MQRENFIYEHNKENADGNCGLPPKGSCTKPAKFMFIYEVSNIIDLIRGVDYLDGSACEEHMAIVREIFTLVVEEPYDPAKHSPEHSAEWFKRTLEEKGL